LKQAALLGSFLLVFILVTGGLAHAGPLVVNGGFESGDFTGWTQSGNTGLTYVGISPNPAHSGLFAAELGPFGSLGFLSQDIPTIAGHSYTVSYYRQASGGSPNEFRVTWGGNTLVDVMDFAAFSPYVLETFSGLLASGPTTTLSLGFQQDVSYQGLDDVTVVDNTEATVPEPSAMALVGGALLVIVGSIRRRRK
jgi:carbohydrate binding protein with CBM4/9 domain/PEP-CTERM motif-containing protein